MRRTVWLACVLTLGAALLAGCGAPAPTTVAEAWPRLPQLIQITVIPEPTATPAVTPSATPTTAPPTPTPTLVPPTIAPTPEPLVLQPARVISFDVVYGQGFPAPVTLVIQGAFDDQCSKIGRIVQARTADGVAVAIYLDRPRDRQCDMAETPFELEAPLDVTGLEVGDYPLTVNGVGGELRLQLGMVVTHNPDLLCAEAGDGQQQARIERDQDAYCFVYPSDYTLLESPEGVTVTARQRSDVPVPLIGEVRVSNLGPVGDLTLRAWAEADLAERAAELPESAWGEISLGLEPAVWVSPVPGEEPTRNVYTVHNGSVYRLVYAPQLPVADLPQITLARELFELVASTFLFYR